MEAKFQDEILNFFFGAILQIASHEHKIVFTCLSSILLDENKNWTIFILGFFIIGIVVGYDSMCGEWNKLLKLSYLY
jgi:hypothetical protein